MFKKLCSYFLYTFTQIKGIWEIRSVLPSLGNMIPVLFGLCVISVLQPWISRSSKTGVSKPFPPHKIIEAYHSMCYAAALYGVEIFLLSLGYFNSIFFRFLSIISLPIIAFFEPLQLFSRDIIIKKFVPWFISDLKIHLFEYSLIDKFKENTIIYKTHNYDNALPSAGVYIDEHWPCYKPILNEKDSCYDNNNNYEMKLEKKSFEEQESTTNEYQLEYIHALVIAVRGSSDISNWLTDFNAKVINVENDCIEKENLISKKLDPKQFGCVHRGIWQAAWHIYNENEHISYEKIMNIIKQYENKKPIEKIIITGHSLGAGITVYLTKLFHESFKNNNNNLKIKPIPIEGFAFASPAAVDYNHVSKYSYDDQNRCFLWCFVYGIDLIPRFSIGSIKELVNRALKIPKIKIPWGSFIFYNILDIYWYIYWLIFGDSTGIINRSSKAFPQTDKYLFDEYKDEECKQNNNYKNDTLLTPLPVYLLWNHANRPYKGRIDPLDSEKHLSTFFWSPIQGLFSHSPVYYLKCLNDLYYQYQTKKVKNTKKKKAKINKE